MWVNINGNWIGRNRGGQKWSSYWNPQTDEHKALMEAVSVKPSITIQHAQNDFIYYLKGNNSDSRNVWDKITCLLLYEFGMTSAEDALLWVNNPLKKAELAGITAPIYTQFWGFTGNGAGYIKTGFNSSVDGGLLHTQNSATIGHIWKNDRRTAAEAEVGAATTTAGSWIDPIASGWVIITKINNQSYASTAIGDLRGTMVTMILSRSAAENYKLYVEKTEYATKTANSVALLNAEHYNLCMNYNGAAYAIQTDSTGGYFTASGFDQTDVNVFIDALRALRVSLNSSFEDSFSGTVIDTTKWTVTNPNTDVALFEQNEELIMHSLFVNNSNELVNNIKSTKTSPFGVWKFAFNDIGTGGASIREVGLISDGLSTDRVRLSRYANGGVQATNYLSIRQNALEVYYYDTEILDSGIFKIVVTPACVISMFKWVDDAWVQIGIDYNAKYMGSLRFYMATRGSDGYVTSINDFVYSPIDFNTLNP